MSRSKGQPRLPIEVKVRLVLAVLAGEVSLAEAARRHGVSAQAVANWRDRFVESGKVGLDNQLPGEAGRAGSQTERRLRAEAEQLKLALAEATVQLRIWQRARSTSMKSLRRPRGPKSGSGDAGLEVRGPGGYPGADLSSTARAAG